MKKTLKSEKKLIFSRCIDSIHAGHISHFRIKKMRFLFVSYEDIVKVLTDS